MFAKLLFVLSNVQVKVMKNLFADYKTPTMAECEMLGHELGLQKRVVQVWYQNSRAKEKKSKLAILKASSPSNTDPEQLKQSLESLTSSSSGGKPAEECVVCGIKYSHKCSIQDHIFTKKHIELIKSRIESGKLDPDAGSSGGGAQVAEVVSAASIAPVQGQSASTSSPVCRQISTSPSPNVSVACSTTTTTVSVASAIPSSTSTGIPCTASNLMAQLPTDSDSVLNGQQQQQHENDQAAFLQQLHLLQLATASSTTNTTTATHYDSQNNGISSNANTGSTSCNADHPDDDNHDTLSNNVNNTATLSPEDLLQLYGLGGGSSLSPFPALPPSPTSIIASSNNNDSNNEGTTTTTPLSSSTSATASTFSTLMQHPLLSNAASALSSSTSSSATTMGPTTGK